MTLDVASASRCPRSRRRAEAGRRWRHRLRLWRAHRPQAIGCSGVAILPRTTRHSNVISSGRRWHGADHEAAITTAMQAETPAMRSGVACGTAALLQNARSCVAPGSGDSSNLMFGSHADHECLSGNIEPISLVYNRQPELHFRSSTSRLLAPEAPQAIGCVTSVATRWMPAAISRSDRRRHRLC